eukprot:CAMPEP_0180159272 /NCGR_PEP_ID=MMETSP0986-20121125/27424_1 /TAXON_ID=697907 /ORGANISM="non described non described, Strain CCMP2293" /LENGTH=120 /DNA_ID=CAMNT_0022109323 /DNA_START=32 /DNA_END=394 /DNA_ORIENTATION=-
MEGPVVAGGLGNTLPLEALHPRQAFTPPCAGRRNRDLSSAPLPPPRAHPSSLRKRKGCAALHMLLILQLLGRLHAAHLVLLGGELREVLVPLGAEIVAHVREPLEGHRRDAVVQALEHCA